MVRRFRWIPTYIGKEARPDINTILKHRFLHDGPFPAYIPASAHDAAPDFRNVSASQSRRNFAEACKQAKVGETLPIVVDKPLRTALGPSIVQQEKDFQNAVQPGSPISALLQHVILLNGPYPCQLIL